jgi:hypothetical protein
VRYADNNRSESVCTAVFGNIGSFTGHTFDYMGLVPGTYNSFHAITEEAAHTRFYGGIHYMRFIGMGL